MGILKVLIYPHRSLRTTAAEVKEVTDDVRTNARDLLETLRSIQDGGALAATQVGIGLRMVALNDSVSREIGSANVILNPKVTRASQYIEIGNESCLSFPGLSLKIARPVDIDVSWMDLDGYTHQVYLRRGGYTPRCLQHEIDHLDGRLFIDQLDRKQKFVIIAQMRKNKISGRR